MRKCHSKLDCLIMSREILYKFWTFWNFFLFIRIYSRCSFSVSICSYVSHYPAFLIASKRYSWIIVFCKLLNEVAPPQFNRPRIIVKRIFKQFRWISNSFHRLIVIIYFALSYSRKKIFLSSYIYFRGVSFQEKSL